VAAGKRTARSVSRRFTYATLLTLPAAGVILLARSDRGDATGKRRMTHAALDARQAPRPALVAREERVSKPLDGKSDSTSRPTSATNAAASQLAAALRRADVDAARELAQRAEDPGQLQGTAMRDALLAVAADASATPHGRAVALALLRRAPAIDEGSVARIATIAADPALDADTRARAIDLLRQLSVNRPDLERPLQAALLDAATHAGDEDARSLALETLSLRGAAEDEVGRVVGWLQDASPRVRTNAARAAGSCALRDRGAVLDGLERALAAESDVDAASIEIEAALRAGRASADALLARMERAGVVRANAALARQINDYRASLGAGETDPLRILADHEAREDALVRSSTKGS